MEESHIKSLRMRGGDTPLVANLETFRYHAYLSLLKVYCFFFRSWVCIFCFIALWLKKQPKNRKVKWKLLFGGLEVKAVSLQSFLLEAFCPPTKWSSLFSVAYNIIKLPSGQARYCKKENGSKDWIPLAKFEKFLCRSKIKLVECKAFGSPNVSMK